jgi:hypothetical protein
MARAADYHQFAPTGWLSGLPLMLSLAGMALYTNSCCICQARWQTGSKL